MEHVNKKTGEITDGHKLGEIVVIKTKRKNGTTRIVYDYQNCPTMTEQHNAHETDLNYLVKKFQPDELAAYIAARNTNRVPIEGHDFSKEPSLQAAKNKILEMQQNYEKLPDEVRKQFPKLVEFLKFLDSEKNVEKLIKFGLLTADEVKQFRDSKKTPTPAPTTPEKEEKQEEA